MRFIAYYRVSPARQGQSVLFSTITTAPPPAQVASIDGGGYSPLVPIPPSVIPVPVSPAAIISPPASVSPPEPTAPTYTPPATVIVNPISPWAPSPVPPPPPPPPPPVSPVISNDPLQQTYPCIIYPDPHGGTNYVLKQYSMAGVAH